MRIKVNNYIVRKSNTREIKKKIYLIFEGEKTEYCYFNQLVSSQNIADIVFLEKEKNVKTWSNPAKILDLIQPIIEHQEPLKETYNSIFIKLYDYFGEDSSESPEKTYNFYKNILERYNINEYEEVDGNKINEIINELNKMILNSDGLFEIISEKSRFFSYYKVDTYFENNDQIFLIVDRDKHSFTDNQFDYVYKQCSNFHIKLIVINPCFEFWLLLHFNSCTQINQNELLENKKINNKTFVHYELLKYDKTFKKNKFDFSIYIGKIPNALKNIKNYSEDLKALKEKVGSNIGELISILYKNDLSKN